MSSAIVGTTNADHIEQSIAASEITLDDGTRARIDRSMLQAVPVGGPAPETMP